PEERVKSSEYRSCRLGELLPALVQAAAADKIHIHRSPRICVNHGVERQRPLPDIPRRQSQSLNSGRVDVKLIVVELKHQSDVRVKVIPGAGIEVPARIDAPSGRTQGLGETTSDVKSKGR